MNNSQRQGGQSLVFVVLAIIALIAMAGLIIDGGYAYAMRRQAQNAADAGALAGARALAERVTCDTNGQPVDGSATDDAMIAMRINEYVERNGIPDAGGSAWDEINTNVRRRYIDKNGNELGAQDIGVMQYVPANAVGVRVTPRLQTSTFFMGVLGFNQVTVAATADARMGVVMSLDGGSIFPVALDLPTAQAAENGQLIRIWTNDKINNQVGGVEINEGGSWVQRGYRGWLSLDYVYSEQYASLNGTRVTDGSHSNNRLKYWCCNDYPHLVYAGQVGNPHTGDFIYGDPGTRSSALDTATCREGQVVIIPIYDAIYSSDYLDNAGFPDPPQPPGWTSPPKQGTLFHIVGFAAVKIQFIASQGNDKYVQSEVKRVVVGGNINPDNPNPCSVLVKSVGLTR